VSISDDDRIAYLSGDSAGPLSPDERAGLDELRDLLATPATWAQPDPGLEDRVVSAIAEEARRAGTRVPDRLPEPAPARRRAGGSPLARLGFLERFRHPGLALGGFAAAAAAVVAVIVVLAVGSGSSTNQLHFAMVVTGTPLAQGAHGSAELTKTTSGWRIELSATGLPHLENGRYYQAWLKNAAGILVPVGTFNDAEHVTLWSGVPVTQYRTLTVTTQLANGNPASSGRRVLIGTISSSH
jgi:hypothetical protein